MLPRRERPCSRNLTTDRSSRQASSGPGRTRKSRCARNRGARARPAPARAEPRSASTSPRLYAIATCPPGAATRASSSKNGIMLFIVTSSNAPSSYGRRDASATSYRCVSVVASRRASSTIPARDVGADDLRLGPPRRNESRDGAAARAEIEDGARRALDAVERSAHRAERDLVHAGRVPFGCEPVERSRSAGGGGSARARARARRPT